MKSLVPVFSLGQPNLPFCGKNIIWKTLIKINLDPVISSLASIFSSCYTTKLSAQQWTSRFEEKWLTEKMLFIHKLARNLERYEKATACITLAWEFKSICSVSPMRLSFNNVHALLATSRITQMSYLKVLMCARRCSTKNMWGFNFP